MPFLISLSGLPGVGKTSIARELSGFIGAVHLRVDSIEAAMKESSLKIDPAEEAGYLVAVAIARDNLSLGLDVIADTVNPLEISRQMWAEAAATTNSTLLDVEVICSDETEHRRRVEARTSDIRGLKVPSWSDVQSREYDKWSAPRLIVDSATLTVAECAREIARTLSVQNKSVS